MLFFKNLRKYNLHLVNSDSLIIICNALNLEGYNNNYLLDIPEYIEYVENNNVAHYYEKNGNSYRKNGPHVIKYYPSGNKHSEYFYENDNLIKHRLDGPSIITYYEDGKIMEEFWYKNNKLHRTDGPARILNYQDVVKKWWYTNGILTKFE